MVGLQGQRTLRDLGGQRAVVQLVARRELVRDGLPHVLEPRRAQLVSTLPTVPGDQSWASASYTGVSTSRTLPLSPTTTTPPTCAAPDTMRWPTPISLVRPLAFTL